MPFRSPCRPSQSPSVTALPEGEPSRGRRPRRPGVAGIRIAAERKRNVRSADPTVDVGPTSALRPPRNDMTRRLSGRGTAGKSPKRRLWRMKRGDFEDVPRLSAATAGESRLARRWAGIAEAPPVADEARRFRGSAPAVGRDSGRESAGTTVGRHGPRPTECLTIEYPVGLGPCALPRRNGTIPGTPPNPLPIKGDAIWQK